MCAAAQQGCAWEHWVRLVVGGEHLGELGRMNSSLQGGSTHSGCITMVPSVPLSIVISPLPSVVDPAKVQSLKDMIWKDPDSVPPSMSCGSKGPMGGNFFCSFGAPTTVRPPRNHTQVRDHPCQDGPVHPLGPNGVYLGASCRTYTSHLLGTCPKSPEDIPDLQWAGPCRGVAGSTFSLHLQGECNIKHPLH